MAYDFIWVNEINNHDFLDNVDTKRTSINLLLLFLLKNSLVDALQFTVTFTIFSSGELLFNCHNFAQKKLLMHSNSSNILCSDYSMHARRYRTCTLSTGNRKFRQYQLMATQSTTTCSFFWEFLYFRKSDRAFISLLLANIFYLFSLIFVFYEFILCLHILFNYLAKFTLVCLFYKQKTDEKWII